MILKVLRRLRGLQVDFVVRVQHTARRTRVTPTAEEQPLQAPAQLAPISHHFELLRPVVYTGQVKWRPTRTKLHAREVWLDSGRRHMNVVHLSFPGRPRGDQHGWTSLTSLAVLPGVAAEQVVKLDLWRWGIEDAFAWTKTALGWEDIWVLEFEVL
ncbi:transposase [Deinococcus arenicola]|uniref:Transposase n=1 Tax=Deinococcus arenicola TaxID=2994950 RepID=A0ABU4DT16_9DEIO|nr:transposase [Deinococcus sp. ZS9-10]MDV6375581.1 transposase [Deinococcus sp. ZS9-10]